MRRILCATLCGLVALVATTALAGDANGVWKWKFAPPNGQEREMSLTLKAEGEKLTGSIAGPQGRNIDIKNGSFKNDEVNFETVFERDGNSFTTRYKGKVEGDSIRGTTERERNGQTNSREWIATRDKK